MIVEPAAGDRVEDNLNPVGRAYYGVLDAALHAGLAVAGGRARARRAGGRGAHPRRRQRRRVHALPPGRRDAVQPRVRGPARSGLRSPGWGGPSTGTPAREPDDERLRRARRRARLLGVVTAAGEPAILLLPTWSIVHSRHWKAQIPYLARHARVVTFDGRGNGLSDRPAGRRGVRRPRDVADALAVLDRLGDRARPSSSGCRAAAAIALELAAAHPERVRAGRDRRHGPRLDAGHPWRRRARVRRGARHRRGLGEAQPPLLAARLPRLPRVLLRRDAPRAALDEADRGLRRVGAGHDAGDRSRCTERELGVRGARGRRGALPRRPLPVVLVHGTEDRIMPARARRARRRADRRTAGRRCPRAGHRRRRAIPVRVNLLLREFVASAAARRRRRAVDARPRAAATGAARLLADRARPRLARRRDRRRAAPRACRAWRSTGSRSSR